MTSKLTREQLHERARENVKALKMASRQTAFESAREEILADLQLAELALAAMDSSESVELPLDYLQGHKDGLEWAAQLAEANHPETGDWLHDDPIELAKAIRKGPDMPPAQPAADSEPVAWTWHYREQWHVTSDKRRAEFVAKDGDVAVLPLYRHAQPAPERDQVRREHAEWSQSTFGSVGPIGPLKHLSKEALEAAAEPGDLSEWADMQFLLWDAQRRAGVTDEQITQAMIDKLAVNKQRKWPEPKDGEPRLHIKEQPAPIVQPMMFIDGDISSEDADKLAKVIRDFNEEDERPLAKMARIIRENPHPTNECDMPKAQQAPVVPDEKDKTVDADDHPFLWSFNEGWNACRAAMLAAAPQPQSAQQNIPEIIPGWIPVSERMPDCWCRTCRPVAINDMRFVVCPDFGNKRCPRANDHRNACTGSNETGQEGSAYPAAPQEVKGE